MKSHLFNVEAKLRGILSKRKTCSIIQYEHPELVTIHFLLTRHDVYFTFIFHGWIHEGQSGDDIQSRREVSGCTVEAHDLFDIGAFCEEYPMHVVSVVK